MQCQNCGQEIDGPLRDHECAPPVKPDPELEQAIAEESGMLNFGDLIQTLQRAQRSRNTQEAMDQIVAAMGKLSDDDLKLVMADSATQSLMERLAAAKVSGMNPGEPIYDEKGRELMRVPYDQQWIDENMPEVEWTVPQPLNGERSWQWVSWNGVLCPIPLIAGTIVKTASAFRDIVLEAWRQQQVAYESQGTVLQFGPSAAADGVSMDTGWSKMTPEELVASGEWRDTR